MIHALILAALSGCILDMNFDQGDYRDNSSTNAGTASGLWVTNDWSYLNMTPCLSLGGSNSLVSAGSGSQFNVSGALSFFCLLKRGRVSAVPSPGYFERVFCRGVAPRYNGFFGGSTVDTNLFVFQYWCQGTNTASTLKSNFAVTDTTDWHAVGVSFNSTNVLYYLDGATNQVATPGAMDATNGPPFVIGNLSVPITTSEQAFKGQIDDVHVFNRALSVAEFQELEQQARCYNLPASPGLDTVTVGSIVVTNGPASAWDAQWILPTGPFTFKATNYLFFSGHSPFSSFGHDTNSIAWSLTRTNNFNKTGLVFFPVGTDPWNSSYSIAPVPIVDGTNIYAAVTSSDGTNVYISIYHCPGHLDPAATASWEAPAQPVATNIPGGYEHISISANSLLKVGSETWMYYHMATNEVQNEQERIGLMTATATVGPYTRKGVVVLEASTNWFDRGGIVWAQVIRHGGVFEMHYHGNEGTQPSRWCRAFSTDGIHFKRYVNNYNPVLAGVSTNAAQVPLVLIPGGNVDNWTGENVCITDDGAGGMVSYFGHVTNSAQSAPMPIWVGTVGAPRNP